MNLPNKLTILRIILIPVFVVLLLANFGTMLEKDIARYLAIGVFVVASLTDFLDGYIARKHKLVTNFGIFMDPIADKLLVSAALVAMVELGLLPAWVVILVISREFVISGLRLIASNQGVVLAASKWGKMKTVTQMMMIIFVLFNMGKDVLGNGIALQPFADISDVFNYFCEILMYLSAVLTVVSAVDYIVKNRHVLTGKPKVN